MYNLVKLSSDKQQFISAILPGERNLVEVALATILAKQVVVPDMVDDKEIYFIQNIKSAVKTKLSTLNEVYTFNFDTVLDNVKMLWDVRYAMRNPSKRIYALDGASAEAIAFGYGKSMVPNFFDNVQKNNIRFIAIYNMMTEVMDTLFENNTQDNIPNKPIVNAVY